MAEWNTGPRAPALVGLEWSAPTIYNAFGQQPPPTPAGRSILALHWPNQITDRHAPCKPEHANTRGFTLRASGPTRPVAIWCISCDGSGDCGHCSGAGCGDYNIGSSYCRNGTCTYCRGTGRVPMPGPPTDVTFVVEPHLARLLARGDHEIVCWVYRSIIRYLTPLGVDPSEVVWTVDPAPVA